MSTYEDLIHEYCRKYEGSVTCTKLSDPDPCPPCALRQAVDSRDPIVDLVRCATRGDDPDVVAAVIAQQVARAWDEGWEAGCAYSYQERQGR